MRHAVAALTRFRQSKINCATAGSATPATYSTGTEMGHTDDMPKPGFERRDTTHGGGATAARPARLKAIRQGYCYPEYFRRRNASFTSRKREEDIVRRPWHGNCSLETR